MKKQKIKLPNGLTIYYWQKECLYKTSGNISKFDIVEIKDGKESFIYMSKLLEKNGQKVEESKWGW